MNTATPPTPDPRERGEVVPSFWAVLRDDNEMMATGKTHDEAVREFMRFRGGDYANAVKEGYRCVAIFTNWPALSFPARGSTEAEREVMGDIALDGFIDWCDLDPTYDNRSASALARQYLALRQKSRTPDAEGGR